MITTPKIGDVVHFVVAPGQCRAAMVTGLTGLLPAPTINLSVQADGPNDLETGYDRPYWVGNIPYAPCADNTPGTWHPREELSGVPNEL